MFFICKIVDNGCCFFLLGLEGLFLLYFLLLYFKWFSYNSFLKEEDEEDLNNKSRMVDIERFENEIGILRESITELRVRQDDMMENLQTGINNISNLLNELTGRPPGSSGILIEHN